MPGPRLCRGPREQAELAKVLTFDEARRKATGQRGQDLMEYEAALRFIFWNDPKGVDL